MCLDTNVRTWHSAFSKKIFRESKIDFLKLTLFFEKYFPEIFKIFSMIFWGSPISTYSFRIWKNCLKKIFPTKFSMNFQSIRELLTHPVLDWWISSATIMIFWAYRRNYIRFQGSFKKNFNEKECNYAEINSK